MDGNYNMNNGENDPYNNDMNNEENSSYNNYGEKVVMGQKIKVAVEKFNKRIEERPKYRHYEGGGKKYKKSESVWRKNRDRLSAFRRFRRRFFWRGR